MKHEIFVALSTFSKFDEGPLKILQQSGVDYTVNPLGRRLIREEVIKMGKEADAIVAGLEPYDEFVLNSLQELRCISRCGVGIDNINLKKAREKNIVIKNTPDAVILPVAELTIGMIFDLLRKISYLTRLMRLRQWHKSTGSLLSGRKAGVLGLGRIGRRVAEMLTGLDADVYGADLSPDHTWADKAGVKIVSKDLLLKECDVITIHISVSEGEGFVFGRREFGSMKDGALLVNTSRGKFVDEEALHHALKSNKLAGAALDVYSEEPYSGPLCDLDNVLLTPHIATLTRESRTQMETEAVQNAIDFFKSE